MDVDWLHIAESVGGSLFGAGVIWGTLKADLKNFHEWQTRQDAAIDRAHDRIDTLKQH